MIGKFGAAKDQWFSSFLLQVENHSSWHRLFVDPLSRAMYSSDGPDFEFVQQKRKEGLSIHEAVWQLAWKKSGPEMASLEAWLATPTTFLVNVNTLEALPLLQGATDAAGFMARMDTVLQMYGGKKGAK